MSDVDAVPAAETDIAERSNIDDVLARRHMPQEAHEVHREVGEEPEAPAMVAVPAATPAPTPEPVAPAAEVKVDPATKPESEQPFWYRQEAKKLRQRAEAAERELAARPRASQVERPASSEEEQNRPVTRAEIAAYHETERLITRVQNSEDTFIDKHGEDTHEEVRGWLLSKAVDGDARNNPMERWAMAQRNPWAAAYQQYQREKMADEIGSDPAAYRAKLEEQIRSEYEAKMAAREDAPAVAATPTMQRSAPPAPASAVRSAAPRDPETGKFTGPAPLRTRNNFS